MKSLVLAGLLVACSGPTSNSTVDGHPGGGGDGGNPPVDAAPTADAPPPTNAVSIIVEPNGNKASELVAAINGATKSVYMTMYEIDDSDVITALVDRKKAGLDVQAVIDGSTTTKSFNTSGFDKLQTAGIDVVWSSTSFTYTHEKTVMIDGATAWIMTMNLNTSSPADNREYLAIDTDPADVAEATAIFQADHAHQAITPSGTLVVADTNARSKLVNLIYSATTTIDLEVEELSDTNTNGIVQALDAAAHRGVTVHCVVANDSPDTQSDTLIKNSGGTVVLTGPSSGNGTPTNPYIHAKAIVVDGTTAFVGSENFSAGSLGYNRELGVIFAEPSEVAKVKSTIDTDFGKGTKQ